MNQLCMPLSSPLTWSQGTPEGVENNGTICRVGTFPIGIDPERFTHALETDEVQSHVAKLLNRYAGRKVRRGADFGSRLHQLTLLPLGGSLIWRCVIT